MKKCALVILVFFGLNAVEAQDHCVDAEFEGVYSQYPKTIPGTPPPGVWEWNGDAWNVPAMKQVKVEGVNIGGNGMFGGLLEYTPPSYSLPANSTKEYPVIIFFHGFASRGDGSTNQLCRILKDAGSDLATHKSLPGRIEHNTGAFTQVYNGTTYEFIVITPQFTKYTRPIDESEPHDFPSADEVSNVIDYVVANYRIDERRIYLTGLSNGANMIVEYAASSVQRARRVAGIMPISLCSPTTSLRNVENNYIPANIGTAGLPVWFVNCAIDNPCDITRPQGWYNGIIATPGHVTPRFTILNNSNPNPLYQCSDSLLHDGWSRGYDPNFTASFVNGSGANDGINLNMYQWFAQLQNVILPVKIKSFSARLANNKVELKWITTDEKNNASFTIERAGADQRYSSIGSVPGLINHTGEKEYSFIDPSPLAGLSYYRLVQIDIDGAKNYLEIKKIINQKTTGSGVIVSPNPFTTEISAFVTIDKSQKVMVSLADINGRILKSANGVYAAGSTEIKLKSDDLPQGVYLLKVSGSNFSISKKIIKK